MWFLDIDGVVSPYGIPGDWDGPTLYPKRFGDLAVPYHREVVEGIAGLHAAGVVEVRWLTTWDAELLEDWTDVGLGPFPAVQRPSGGRRRWWKANAVEQWMASHHRRAVWTDDDLTPGRARGFDRTRLLTLSPDPRIGLRLQDLARIERWAMTTPL